MRRRKRAILWIISTQFLVAWLGVPVRAMANHVHTSQIIFFTLIFASLFLMPWLLRDGIGKLSTKKLPLYCLRSFIEVIGFNLSFFAMTLIALPQVTSLQFLSPIFFGTMSVLLLREEGDRHTLLALLGGFSGVLLITRPGFGDVSIGMLYAISAALCFGTCGVIIRVLSRTETPQQITFYMLYITIIPAGIFALFNWVTPHIEVLLWGVIAGGLFCGIQFCVSRALSLVPASVVTPFYFTQLIFVSIIAYIFFGEVITIWTLAGAVVILFSAMYSFHHTVHNRCKNKGRA